MFKTVPQVYRDCLRLIEHVGGHSRKADVMRSLVAREFRAHKDEKDEKKIEDLKRNAMTGLANYLTIESLGKLEHQPDSPNKSRGVTTAAHLSNLPQRMAPVSDRVLALQARIRAQKAARDEEVRKKGTA